MDGVVTVIKESHGISDFTASASKSLGSLVYINSIAIDINNAMDEIEMPAVHEHFSIRGFVAGMRRMDLKKCLPFSSDGDSCVLMDNLPPLDVPKFQWWQCSSEYIPASVVERSSVEMAIGGRSHAVTRSCQDADLDKCVSSSQGIGKKHRLRDNGGTRVTNQTNNCMSSDPCCTERHEALACGKDGLKIEVRYNEGRNPHEANPVLIRCGQKHDAGDASRVVRVAEPDNSSSGSDGVLTALLHKRKPKLRSLEDIMVEGKNPPIENQRTKSTSSCGVQATSTEIEEDFGPQLQPDSSAEIVPPDIAKGIRSPPRKRKATLEEDRVSLAMTCPSGSAKRSRSVVLDAERTYRGAEVSHPESGQDASDQLDLQLGTKTTQMKPKKNKTPVVCKNMRPNHIDMKGTFQLGESPKINTACFTHFQKDLPTENSFAKLGCAPSTLGEMRSYFGNFISVQQTERTTNAPNSKKPRVEPNHDTLMAPRKSMSRDCNNKGKVTLDLSLNSFRDVETSSNNHSTSRQHRGIPDLNETFSLKTDAVRGKQLLKFSETRSFSLQKSLDISETSREDKRQSTTSDRLNTENNIEMEIIELLAKNQRERAVGNSRKHSLPEGITKSVRGSPGVYLDRHSGMFSFPVTNRRCALNVPNENVEVCQNVPMNFPRLNKCQLNLINRKGSQLGFFNSFTPSQPRKTPHPVSSPLILGPRHVGMTELFWPSRTENMPLHPGMPQNHSYQMSSMHNQFSSQWHKKTTIDDVRTGIKSKNAHDPSTLREGRIGPGATSLRSLDHYANDTIPAMQLLSLMDQGIVSGSSYKVGRKHFLDKPFSQCNHHPGTEKENQSFLNGSFFRLNDFSKNFPEPRYGACWSGESSKKVSSHLQGQISAEQGILVNQPARSDPELGECVLNRNPADFSVPDSSNEFMISARNLKPRKRNVSKHRKYQPNCERR